MTDSDMRVVMKGDKSWNDLAVTNRTALVLAASAALLALLASVLGLTVAGIYGADSGTAHMLRGFDLVTAAVAVPILGGALWEAGHGSLRGGLLTAGVLGYLVYTYAYYIFGTGFNDLFLIHTATFSVSLFALITSLASFDRQALRDQLRQRTPVRTIAILLALLGVSLGALWVFWAVSAVLTDALPPGSSLVETDSVVHLGMALDLAVLVPTYLTAAVLLWRRTAWGVTLAAIALVSGVFHQVTYMMALVFQTAAGVPGSIPFDPAEPLILALYVVAAVLLLAGIRRTKRKDS
ncbi:hypothetical protein [Mycetocola miduiensis]|uniref:Uncharacterized protein n=1 Tax=Mycetocola miduiensis TaxID=995034 RepID=A0A1I5CVF1_9MICO|nr:hypothetical protein [Mycetocola miduiensis]SFN90929.1 hypothetical protein SAMN05216219_2602 [Mycetocola miduiensis]